MPNLAVFGADDAVVIIVIVVIVVVGLIGAWLLSTSYRLLLAPSGSTIVQGSSATLGVTFQKRTWRFGSWLNEPATISTRISAVSGVLAVNPSTGSTTAAAPTLTITVSGLSPGSDTVHVTATSTTTAASASGDAPFTVTGV